MLVDESVAFVLHFGHTSLALKHLCHAGYERALGSQVFKEVLLSSQPLAVQCQVQSRKTFETAKN